MILNRKLRSMRLMVADIAGTCVQEGGMVYKTIQNVLKDHGMPVSDREFSKYHGIRKETVFEQVAQKYGNKKININSISSEFNEALSNEYNRNPPSLIHPSLLYNMENFRQQKSVKITLDTGYPAEIAEAIIKTTGLDAVIDGYISAYEVSEGRPSPYMIHRLMERHNIHQTSDVCKIGDTRADMVSGHNAGCGLVIGVLTGADSETELLDAGADVVVNSIAEILKF